MRACLVLLVLVLVPRGARAEAWPETSPVPVPGVVGTAVRVSRDGGVAKITQTFVITSTAGAPSETTREVPLPTQAAVVGARLIVDGKITVAEITEANAAAERFERLRERGEATSRPVLLVTTSSAGAELSLAWLAPGQRVTVELDSVAPLERGGGAHEVELPCPQRAQVVVVGGALEREPPGKLVFAHGLPFAPRCRATWPSDVTTGVFARWARVTTAPEEAVVRLEIEAARELEPRPQRAHVVFVVDLSHSEGEDGVRAELELVHEVVRHLPDARVAVLGFSRRVHPLTRGFVAARQLPQALARADLTTENGSDPSGALAEAARLLAGKPGPTRVIVITDRQLPLGFSGEGVRAAFTAAAPKDTIVHVVERGAFLGSSVGAARLDHPDDVTTDFGPLLVATGGELLAIVGGGAAAPRGALAEAALELVRPTRLDDVIVIVESGDGLVETWVDGDALPAGAALVFTELRAPRPYRITVRGRLWGRRFERVLLADPAFAAQLPALAVGVLGGALDRDALRHVGLAHGVLTLETSLLAVPAQAAPSQAGVEPFFGGGTRGAPTCMCAPSAGLLGHGSGTGSRIVGPRQPPDPLPFVQRAFAPGAAACVARHGEPRAGARLELELREPEVLAVTPRDVGGTLADCLVEAAWALDLRRVAVVGQPTIELVVSP